MKIAPLFNLGDLAKGQRVLHPEHFQHAHTYVRGGHERASQAHIIILSNLRTKQPRTIHVTVTCFSLPRKIDEENGNFG